MKRPLLFCSAILILACSGQLEELGGPVNVQPVEVQPSIDAPVENTDANGGEPDNSGDPTTDEVPSVTSPVDCSVGVEITDQPCALADLSCGDVVVGEQIGNESRFDDDFYRSKFCAPQSGRYGLAAESIYSITVPPNTRARVKLNSPCTELDLAAVHWSDAASCPTTDHRVTECEMDTSSGDGEVVVTTVDRPRQYLIVVDGKRGAEGAFRLGVTCEEYR